MSDRKRKSYTPEYRRDAAHLMIDTGRTIAVVANEIGVGEQLLGRWVGIERSRMVDLNRPGSGTGSDSTERWSHASTEEVPKRVA
jgi:transposase-like protein